MKTLENIFGAIIFFALIVGGFLGYSYLEEKGLIKVELFPKEERAVGSTPTPKLPAVEATLDRTAIISDMGGQDYLTQLENIQETQAIPNQPTPTPLPPLCTLFKCNVELANEEWASLAGEQGYTVGVNLVTTGIEVRRSAEVCNEFSDNAAEVTKANNRYGNTTVCAGGTVNIFARGAADISQVRIKISDLGNEKYRVEIIIPPMCIDSMGIKLDDQGRPSCSREILKDRDPAWHLFVCNIRDINLLLLDKTNAAVCSSSIYSEESKNTLRDDSVETAARLAIDTILGSEEFLWLYESQFLLEIAPDKMWLYEEVDTNNTLGEIFQEAETAPRDTMILLGQAVICNMLSATGRTCDLNKVTVVVIVDETQELRYCNGREVILKDIVETGILRLNE